MLKRFELSNIKNFKDKFVMDLSDVHDYQFNLQCIKNGIVKDAIIYGKNSVGKSNFGMALFDIVYALTDLECGFYLKKSENSFINADNKLCDSGEFVYYFQFDGSTICFKYRKRSISDIIDEQLIIDNELIYSIGEQNVQLSNLSKIGVENISLEFYDSSISFFRYLVKNSYLPDNSIVKKMYRFIMGMQWVRSFENNQLIPIRDAGTVATFLVKNNLVEDYSNFMKEFGIPNELRIEERADGRRSLYDVHNNTNIDWFLTASSGTLSLTSLYYAINCYKDISFLWLDEFDAFYHFELSEKVMNYLSKNKMFQVVCASHNTGIMSNRILRPDCYFILSRKRLTSLPNATTRELREGHNKDVYGSVKKCVQEIDAQFAGNRYYEYCYQANYRKIVKSERTFKYISEYANINKIKKILLAYKLFYVGCSRVKKELTVFVSADKVKSYKQQFIDTFSKMEFEVCECKMGLPKN